MDTQDASFGSVLQSRYFLFIYLCEGQKASNLYLVDFTCYIHASDATAVIINLYK